MVRNEKYMDYIRYVMTSVNFLFLIFLQYTMICVTKCVQNRGIARDFLSKLPVIPFQAEKSLGKVLVVFIILVVLMEVKNLTELDESIYVLIFVFEVICCVLISCSTCVECSGIILLVVADIMIRIRDRYQQLLFLVIMSVIYLACNYNILAIHTRLVSFSDYLIIFSRVDKAMILAIKDILNSVNIICFIIYMVILMRKQMKEKEEILILNTKLNIMNEELKDANVKLTNYAALQKQLGETEERNRIAREIHDTLGHTMTGLAAGLDACKMLIDVSVPETKETIQMLGDVAREGLNDIRRSVNKLRPDVLENLSLADAIKRLIKQNIDMYKVAIYYECTLKNLKFEPDEENVIYRILQEGMTNSIRHGKAKFIYVEIRKEDIWLVIVIEDNGCGCSDIVEGFGLTHMKERLDMLQGTIDYDGSNGFKITAKIPVRWRDENDSNYDS